MIDAQVKERIVNNVKRLGSNFSPEGVKVWIFHCEHCGNLGDDWGKDRPNYCGKCGTKLSPHSNIESHSLDKILQTHV